MTFSAEIEILIVSESCSQVTQFKILIRRTNFMEAKAKRIFPRRDTFSKFHQTLQCMLNCF